MKRILLVEDESHKQEELSGYIMEFFCQGTLLDVVQSVREAMDSVKRHDYDLIILDMALPTFTTDQDNIDGGRDQALGGVEVLRKLKSLDKTVNVVIVTQYPDILLEGKRVKLKQAQPALASKYNQNIAGAMLYKYKSTLNRQKLKNILDTTW